MKKTFLFLLFLTFIICCGKKETPVEIKEYVNKMEELSSKADGVQSARELKMFSLDATKYMFNWSLTYSSKSYSDEEKKMIDDATNKFNIKLRDLLKKYPIEYNTDKHYDQKRHGELPIDAFCELIQKITEKLEKVSTQEEFNEAHEEYMWGMDSILKSYPKEAIFLVYKNERVQSESERMNKSAKDAERRIRETGGIR